MYLTNLQVEIKKVRAEGKILKISVPKNSGIKVGDYVAIEKINPLKIIDSRTEQPHDDRR